MLVGSERIHSSRQLGFEGLEEGQVHVQGDGLIAQSEAEISDQSLGRVILGILLQDVTIRGDCFPGSCHDFGPRCRPWKLELKLFR